MKKFVKSLLLFLTLVISIPLSGCRMLTGLEKDASVVLLNNDRIVASYKVNIFSNALIGGLEEELIPDGQKFLGWSSKTDWTYGVDSEEDLYPPESLIRYQDIKGELVNNVFTLNAAFVDKELISNNYLVIGWYAKTSTSGLNETIIAEFTASLTKFVTEQGATEDDLAKLIIRPYDGAVADVGTAVNKDGDVDILIGVGNNIDSTGGITCIEKVGDIPMGGKSRYIALLKEKDVARTVFNWLQTAEAQESLQ